MDPSLPKDASSSPFPWRQPKETHSYLHVQALEGDAAHSGVRIPNVCAAGIWASESLVTESPVALSPALQQHLWHRRDRTC